MKKSIFILLSLFLLVEGVCDFSEIEFKNQLEALAQTYLKQNNAAGLAIAVVKNSFDMEKPYKKNFCFGYSKRSQKAPIKEFTLFRIGALSKTLLAATLMQCVQEKKLSLEDSISKYLPKTFAIPKYHDSEIKLIDLAMHTSSLPSTPTMPMKLYEVSEVDIENYFRNYKLPRIPGKKYEGSDLGYSVMAHLLTRVEKASYGILLSQKILKPLEMNETYFSIPLVKMNHLATGYKGIAEVGDLFVDRDGSFFKPCRGVVSTIEDLGKWLSFLLKENPSCLEGCLKLIYATTYTLPDNPLKKRVPGFRVEALSFKNSLTTYREEGIYQGFSQAIAFIPATKTGVVILSNTEYSVEALATTLLELLNQ